MPNADHDPLWYDRVEPDEPPGLPLHVAAWIVVSARAFFRLPATLAELVKARAGRSAASKSTG